MPENALGKGESLNLGKLLSGREPRAKGKGLSNDLVFGKGFVKLSMALSTPSNILSSPSKRSGSPSKGPIVLNKTERMIFMEPRITFESLSKTNEGGYLIGKLQKLWQSTNWHERKVIPSAFKVGFRRCRETLAMLILT